MKEKLKPRSSFHTQSKEQLQKEITRKVERVMSEKLKKTS